MENEKDIAALLELLKMATEQSLHSEIAELSQNDFFREDRCLLEMWPEACQRTGSVSREFPSGVLKLWQQRLGRAN
jgi:hypothetical protein